MAMAKDSNVIYSTLTSSQRYTKWRTGSDVHSVDKEVLIKGGANVADKAFTTPKGVVTIVTDAQLALLESNPSFNRHVERGFILVEKGKSQGDVEKAISDMVGRDDSAPLVDADFAEGKAPKTSGSDAPPPPPSGRGNRN